MVLKQATPALQLPPGATLAVVNYEAMGIRFMEDMIHWCKRKTVPNPHWFPKCGPPVSCG